MPQASLVDTASESVVASLSSVVSTHCCIGLLWMGQVASACAAPSGSEADRETHQGHTALEAGFVLPGLGEFGSTDGDGCHDQVPD